MKNRIFIAILATVVTGGALFYACQKENTDTTIENQTLTTKPVLKQGDLIGWEIIVSDGVYRSASDGCSREGIGCAPTVEVIFICKECQDPDYTPPFGAKPIYDISLPPTDGDDNGTDDQYKKRIIGNTPAHKLIIEMMQIDAEQSHSFVETHKKELEKMIEAETLNKIIEGEYCIKYVEEQNTGNEYTFKYLIVIAYPTAGEYVEIVPLSFIYEFN